MANLDNLKHFKKGNQASKGYGRPKGSKSLTTVLNIAIQQPLTLKNNTGKLEKKITTEWLVSVMIREALKGSHKHLKEIWDRTEGKPLQTIATHESKEIDASTLTDEQLNRIIEKGNLE